MRCSGVLDRAPSHAPSKRGPPYHSSRCRRAKRERIRVSGRNHVTVNPAFQDQNSSVCALVRPLPTGLNSSIRAAQRSPTVLRGGAACAGESVANTLPFRVMLTCSPGAFAVQLVVRKVVLQAAHGGCFHGDTMVSHAARCVNFALFTLVARARPFICRCLPRTPPPRPQLDDDEIKLLPRAAHPQNQLQPKTTPGPVPTTYATLS